MHLGDVSSQGVPRTEDPTAISALKLVHFFLFDFVGQIMQLLELNYVTEIKVLDIPCENQAVLVRILLNSLFPPILFLGRR